MLLGPIVQELSMRKQGQWILVRDGTVVQVTRLAGTGEQVVQRAGTVVGPVLELDTALEPDMQERAAAELGQAHTMCMPAGADGRSHQGRQLGGDGATGEEEQAAVEVVQRQRLLRFATGPARPARGQSRDQWLGARSKAMQRCHRWCCCSWSPNSGVENRESGSCPCSWG